MTRDELIQDLGSYRLLVSCCNTEERRAALQALQELGYELGPKAELHLYDETETDFHMTYHLVGLAYNGRCGQYAACYSSAATKRTIPYQQFAEALQEEDRPEFDTPDESFLEELTQFLLL